MNVSLTPQLERLIQKKVKSGNYQSASEVIREALRLMQSRDQRLEDLRRSVQSGIDEIERGEGIELRESDLGGFFDEIKSRGRQRHSKRTAR